MVALLHFTATRKELRIPGVYDRKCIKLEANDLTRGLASKCVDGYELADGQFRCVPKALPGPTLFSISICLRHKPR